LSLAAAQPSATLLAVRLPTVNPVGADGEVLSRLPPRPFTLSINLTFVGLAGAVLRLPDEAFASRSRPK
jgi:hypothetical protein